MYHALDQTSQLSSDWNPWMTVRRTKPNLTGGNPSKAMWNHARRLLTLPAARQDDICWSHCSQNCTNASRHTTTRVCREGLAFVWVIFLTRYMKCTESPSDALTALGEFWTYRWIRTIHMPKYRVFEIDTLWYLRDPMTRELWENYTVLQGNRETRMA